METVFKGPNLGTVTWLTALQTSYLVWEVNSILHKILGNFLFFFYLKRVPCTFQTAIYCQKTTCSAHLFKMTVQLSQVSMVYSLLQLHSLKATPSTQPVDSELIDSVSTAYLLWLHTILSLLIVTLIHSVSTAYLQQLHSLKATPSTQPVDSDSWFTVCRLHIYSSCIL